MEETTGLTGTVGKGEISPDSASNPSVRDHFDLIKRGVEKVADNPTQEGNAPYGNGDGFCVL